MQQDAASQTLKISVIAGARPNFMKIAPIVRALQGHGIEARIIHTGQHYDQKMSGTFFQELRIPEPHANLGVGSGSHVVQIAEVMKRLETEFDAVRPDILIVVGDVNSTVAGAMTAAKMGIPVAHVEAGLRSGDRSMPEELNRLVTDTLSDWHFTSEPAGAENLQREGVPPQKIHFVGNVMIDTLLTHLPAARELNVPKQFAVEPQGYAVLTLHRPSNVDNRSNLQAILRGIGEFARQMPVVFPIHPRTRARLQEYGFDQERDLYGLRLVEPVGYLAMLGLVDGSRLVLTDSGGLQEETTALRVPCLTLRENTERPITTTVGSNRLVGCSTEAIRAQIKLALGAPVRTGQVPELWDGQAAERIAAILVRR